ncbi:MAG: tetratricopeptide repeat protein [Acidobacteriia bacterium]|nr:tetratricopeptide repeat protein [Terriglobia bacterium]
MKPHSCYAGFSVLLLAGLVQAQTFDVHGTDKHNPPNGTKHASSEAQSLGWGSNIDVTREARAAQNSLGKNDYAAAASHAQQAVRLAPQDANLWFLLGYAARLAGRYPTSIDAYKRGLQLQPRSAQGLSGLAQTYAKSGRTDEARQLLLQVIEAAPNDVNTLTLAGELMVNSDPSRAAEVLLRSNSLRPAARTELLLARAYQRSGRTEEARRYLTQARNRAPHDPEILRAIAGQYRDNQQYELAISMLLALPSKPVGVLAELAYTYELAGKKQQAADTYLQAAKLEKGNVELQLSVAQALINVDRLDAARGFLQRAQELNPNHYRLHAVLAQIEKQANNTSGAIREFQLALRNLPPVVPEGPLYRIQLRFDLYQVCDSSGDPDNAKEQLRLAAGEIQATQGEGAPKAEFLRLRGAIEAASGDLVSAERDLKEALALAPANLNTILSYASLLWKLKQPDAARAMFEKAIKADPDNPAALSSLGYLARDAGNNQDAEKYFTLVVRQHPQNYAPYLALGDLFASERAFPSAEANYEAAYKRMPDNPLIIAGGANAALEAHDLELAAQWLDRAKGAANENPQVMRERERYLTWKGSYLESANLGFKVLEQLPDDAEAPVYLAYDLYYLGRYEEALELSARYEPRLVNNKDFALIAGYVHARSGLLQDALSDFTRALARDPNMATGYVSRGYVFNDLLTPAKAVMDFQAALALQPEYGEAHLGLAYAYLQQHRAQLAKKQLDLAEKLLGTSRIFHLGRAEAFRQEHQLTEAALEYRAALKEEPRDLVTQLALADALYHLHLYSDSIDTLRIALELSPDNPFIYAHMSEAYARVHKREDMLRSAQEAERLGNGKADILMTTGNAFLFLGDENAAMQRFGTALDAPDGHRLSTRLAIAEIFVRKNHWDDARRQIGLGLAEARIGEAEPATPDDLVQAANIFLSIHDFDLAETYFQRAESAGADRREVAIGLANTYLAQGDATKAQAQLASLGDRTVYKDDYDYTMAEANIYRERQDTIHALTSLARATALRGQDDSQQSLQSEYELAGEEGRQINKTLSLLAQASLEPVLEDINIYTLDAKLLGVTDAALLPPPRHSYQDLGAVHYRLHFHGLPTITGFAGEGMTTGRLSLPSVSLIQDRNTYDTMLNGGVTPVVHFGSNSVAFNPGVQFTLRRDTISPLALNQNLFRQFLYFSTNSFFNWISVHGSAIHESGPFKQQNLHSRDLAASVEFVVGRPWGKTALITGYSARDLLFRPAIREYFTTSTYIGLQRKFGKQLTVTMLGEYARSWRVQDAQFAIAQAVLPSAKIEYKAGTHWTVQGQFTFSRGEGFHAYDNARSQFLVSYVRPVTRSLDDGNGDLRVSYPAKFSFGIQQQTFYNFGGQGRNVFLPVVRVTLF